MFFKRLFVILLILFLDYYTKNMVSTVTHKMDKIVDVSVVDFLIISSNAKISEIFSIK